MKKYPTYKPSGVDWLEQIPSNWQPIKLKFLANRITKGTTPTTVGKAFVDSGINFIKVECISETGTIIKDNCAFIDKETHQILNRSQLKKGDVIIAIAGAIGRVAIVGDDIIPANTNQAVGIISVKKNKYDLQWVKYVLNSDAIKQHYNIEVVQTAQANLSLENVGLSLLPTPSLPEQQSIVRFLDYKTGQIDNFIANRHKQIELLKEQKAGIINKAVTKGINPDAKMKPSGIEWIGEINKDWELQKLKYLCWHISVSAFSKEQDETYIALENIESWTGKFLYSEEYSGFDSTAKKFTEEDILFGKLRPYLAKVAMPDFKGVCVSEIIVLRPIKLLKEFLYFILLNADFIDFVSQTAEGTKMPRTSWNKIGDLKFPLLSKDEQKLILDYIKTEASIIDTLISKYQKQIDLMHEYRTSLISQAVTGKIDVRYWQPKKKVET